MEVTMSGIVSGIGSENEQTADLELVDDAKAPDLVDTAGAPRDLAAQSEILNESAKEIEHVNAEPVP
jgi:hypothetical protein